jgi:GNAT superfamily N-acetyltransferase
MTSLPSLSFREVTAADDLAALTHLIRSAYAPHAASRLRYWAPYQSVEDTGKRLASGPGFVGELNGKVVSTVNLKRAEPDSEVERLREPHTWSFGQFAVAPEHKGKGFGKLIHDFALGYAATHGCTKMALHTAQPALGLIAMHQSWGYALVGTCDWRPRTNFLRILMSKPLAAPHRQMRPKPSLKRSANGRPPSSVRRYAVHFRQPGPGILPSSPAQLER